jgi:hypothetical protein
MPAIVTEAAFTRQVIDLARLHGWSTAHFRTVCVQRRNGEVYYETPVQGDGKGFPDLLLIHRRRRLALVAELKVPPNTVTPEQRAWLQNFEAAGVPAYVFRPEDWDEIVATLRGQ